MDINLSKLIPIRISLFKVMIRGVHAEISFYQIFNSEKYTLILETKSRKLEGSPAFALIRDPWTI